MIDVHIAPGMTIPNDLNAMIALCTKEKITRIDADFTKQTILTSFPEKVFLKTEKTDIEIPMKADAKTTRIEMIKIN